MKLKDWEIYNKASKTSPHIPKAERIPTTLTGDSQSFPGYVIELHEIVAQIQRLPQEDVELATRILKQFLR
ncbi:MAG TPA: hypothetical protein VJ824_03275 [Bacillota bacterium]|nr:hypothetical protein [Bacillota bacterium]